MNVHEEFAKIVQEFRGQHGITVPANEPDTKRNFGSSGLRIGGKVFAMLSSDEEFVVKLPRERVNQLVASGEGKPFDPRKNGQVMKEWIVMQPKSKSDWLQLTKEAKEFVSRA